jgi:hypothetical protein
MAVKVPTPSEYVELPYAERLRCVNAMRDLLKQWAATEVEDVLAVRQRLIGEGL